MIFPLNRIHIKPHRACNDRAVVYFSVCFKASKKNLIRTYNLSLNYCLFNLQSHTNLLFHLIENIQDVLDKIILSEEYTVDMRFAKIISIGPPERGKTVTRKRLVPNYSKPTDK